MNVLLIGSGGREHALAWKLVQSPRIRRLYATPGNPGIAEHAELIKPKPSDHPAILAFALEKGIDLAVIGPEQPLVDGLADVLTSAGIATFGPSADAARLEGSKAFTKQLCDEAGIPTARYAAFDDLALAEEYVRREGAPIVIKADGLAAGKGVTVAETIEQALLALRGCFDEPGAKVVIEECLDGAEASLFALSDGTTAVAFGTAQDYKRAFDGDAGPNTGGMGAISPAPALSPAAVEEAMARIVRPTIAALAARGTPFRGVLYAGLMMTASGPKLIEYNVRFGDPECQVLMPRLDSDLLEVLNATATGNLGQATIRWSDAFATTVVVANSGYPGSHDKGGAIEGIDAANALPDVTVFQAGTAMENHQLIATGGRVLSVTATGPTAATAREKAYQGVAEIHWPGAFHRADIGLL